MSVCLYPHWVGSLSGSFFPFLRGENGASLSLGYNLLLFIEIGEDFLYVVEIEL